MSTTGAPTVITALSQEELAAIDAEIAHLPYPSAVAIDALKIVQAHRGWVSDESLQAVARHIFTHTNSTDGLLNTLIG